MKAREQGILNYQWEKELIMTYDWSIFPGVCHVLEP